MFPTAFHGAMLALLVFAGILNYADRQVIAILKPTLEQALGWTDATYGSLVSAFQFAAALAFLGVGWLVDRIGVIRANPLGVAAWSVAAMAHGVITQLPHFFAARIALGATEAIGTPAAVKTIAALFGPEHRAMALGLMNAAASVGAILTPLCVPFLALAVGWRLTFVILGGLGFVWVAAWVLTVRGRADRFQVAAAAAGPASGWRAAFRDRRTAAIAGAKALSDHVWWVLLFWMPDLLHRQFQREMHELAVPLAVIYLAAAAGSLAGGAAYGGLLSRGVSRNAARKLIFLVCGLCVLPLPLTVEADALWGAVALFALALAAHQAFSVNLFSLITELVPAARLGLVTGIGALSGNLAGMAALQATGLVLSAGLGFLPMLLVASVAYLLALGWLHLLVPVFPPGSEGGRHPAPEPA